MKETFYIRQATLQDAQELLDIYTPYIKKTAITFEWEAPSLEEFKSRIENTLRKFPYIVAVEKSTGSIKGYAYASPFKERAAYDWAIETSIYVEENSKGKGIGKILLESLEKALVRQNVLNSNACIAYADTEDEYLTNASVAFHEKMGYRMIGEFHDCGFKFNRWYSMVWMEKMLGEHKEDQPPLIFWPEVDENFKAELFSK